MICTVLVIAVVGVDTSSFELKAKELFDSTTAPGMTCAIRHADGRIESYGFGMADKDSRRSMKPSDRMLAGSAGKTFFAAATLALAAEGKIELDAPLRKYLGSKAWFDKVPNAEFLTFRSLMNHTSGIPEYVSDAEVVALLRTEPDRVFGHEELVERFIAGKPPLFEAGKGWGYADANFVLAGVAVEAACRIDLYREIETRFLKRFDLKATVPSVRRKIDGLATGYSGPNSPFLPAGPVLEKGVLKLNPQFEWAGGGFVSTSRDLAVWMHALMSGKALGEKWTKEMLAGVPAKTGPNDRYGLGAIIEPLSSGVTYGHEGWFPGYLTQAAYFPESGISIAIQFNTDDGRTLKRRTRGFIDELAKAVQGKSSARSAERPRRNAGDSAVSAE